MTSHTPVPWQYYADLPSTEPNWHIVTNESRMRVVANVHIEPGNAMDEANAKLIAAAPALLAALQAFMPELDKREMFISANDSSWSQSEIQMLDRIRAARKAVKDAGGEA